MIPTSHLHSALNSALDTHSHSPHTKMLIVGLTGGIATGKSTVSKLLKDKHDLTIVDADVIAREILEPGQPAYKKVVEHFKGQVTDLFVPDSDKGQGAAINRPALGRAVFGKENEKNRLFLNSVTHPAVRKAIVWQGLSAWIWGNRLVVLDIPLLFESKLDRYCGMTVVVSCSDPIQVERLMKRDGSDRADAEKRIESQMSVQDKKKLADKVLSNDGTLAELELQVDDLVKTITPGIIWTFLTWIPPIGLASALWTYVDRNYIRSKL
ncbi:uncharacterized protein YALI1_F13202g [Yarrowia lipolytica]|uniref:Dephospho-CoA kinase CAB5 n=1 Tax=Yarrowia lipolytica TaxID=4952 RepID=A0A1D8NMP6_YARLL|nr:hypothetical protein YALI1_F13202g [Yarrowia lipolytica]